MGGREIETEIDSVLELTRERERERERDQERERERERERSKREREREIKSESDALTDDSQSWDDLNSSPTEFGDT